MTTEPRRRDLFDRVTDDLRSIDEDEWLSSYGGLGPEVEDLISGPEARVHLAQAREWLESQDAMDDGTPRLRQVAFGDRDLAPELDRGEVAAVDGTWLLPMQAFSTGQAIAVGVTAVTYTDLPASARRVYTSRVELDAAAGDPVEFMRRQREVLQSLSSPALMRWCELEHALAIPQPYILCDGPIIYEWLLWMHRGPELYRRLLEEKQVLGVIKKIASPSLAIVGRVLQPGEVFIVETVRDHLHELAAGRSEERRTAVPPAGEEIAGRILRGVFKPQLKAFGFEVSRDHLEPMLRILAADASMTNHGHEIPFLLNIADAQARACFKADRLKAHITSLLASDSEDLFFGETDEHEFRD